MIERNWPANSYEATLWDVITNAHQYVPKPGDFVLDLGAHYGMFALYSASRWADVVAYEPIYEAFQELEHTSRVADEIGAGRISAVNMAVWDKAGVIPLWKSDHKPCFSAMSRIPITESDVKSVIMRQTRAVSFDDALGETRWACVKMDVEGAEHRLLTNCSKFRQIAFLSVEIHNDILAPEECDHIDALLRDSFSQIDRLPVKRNPAQTVAYFCRGGK